MFYNLVRNPDRIGILVRLLTNIHTKTECLKDDITESRIKTLSTVQKTIENIDVRDQVYSRSPGPWEGKLLRS